MLGGLLKCANEKCKAEFEKPNFLPAADVFENGITAVGVNILVQNKDNDLVNRFWGPLRTDKIMACPSCGKPHLYGFQNIKKQGGFSHGL